MTNISYTGAFSAATLAVPGVYLNVLPSGQGVIGPATFDLLGIVGVASWGPVGVGKMLGDYSQLALFGPLSVRSYDLVSHATVVGQIQQAAGVGAAMVLCRVTDGSDTAAAATVLTSCLTLTGKYTGVLGNSTVWTLAAGSSASTYKLTLQLQGYSPEVYDNISQGVSTNTVTAGTGATAVPTLAYSAPQLTGGLQAQGTASLVVVGTPTIGAAAGTGFVSGDKLTFANGVVLVVNAVAVGVITSFQVASYAGGSVGSLTGTGTAIPVNPVPMLSTNSAGGTGPVTANLVWGLGPVVGLFGGSGYTSASVTVGAGSNGTIAVGVGYWANMANAVNQGNSPLRGPSQIAVATAGTAVTAPTPSTGVFTGGTDGAAGVTPAMLVGIDTAGARTGIYAFRNMGLSDVVVADLSDITQEANLIAFGQSEGVEVHSCGPQGETPSTGASNKTSSGSNNPWLRRWLGDWCYWQDNYNGTLRLIGPSTFGAALMSTLRPEQSGLNKQVVGVTSTQRTRSGNAYGNDELGTLVNAGIDVITNPIPAGPMFGCVIGLNSSSDHSRNGDNWPRLTSFLARSLTGPGALGTLIGQDVTPSYWTDGYAMLDAYLSGLVVAGTIQGYNIEFGPGNNPPAQVATGLVVAQVLVQYLSITRVFLVNMQSGQTVVLPATQTAATAV